MMFAIRPSVQILPFLPCAGAPRISNFSLVFAIGRSVPTFALPALCLVYRECGAHIPPQCGMAREQHNRHEPDACTPCMGASPGGESQMRHTHLKHLAQPEQNAWKRCLQPEHRRISPNTFSPQHPQEGSAIMGVKKATAVAACGCGALAEGGGGGAPHHRHLPHSGAWNGNTNRSWCYLAGRHSSLEWAQ